MAAMAAGVLLAGPASGLAFLVKPLVMFMLWTTFLKVPPRALRPHPVQFRLLIASPILAAAAFLLLKPLGEAWVVPAVLIALTPTAIAAPVLVGFLGGNPGFATGMVVLGNLLLPLLFPPAMALLTGAWQWDFLGPVFLSVVLLVFVPLVAAWLPMLIAPRLATRLASLGRLNFAVWLTVLFLVGGTATRHLQGLEESARGFLLAPLLVGGVLCLVQFGLGRFLGRPGLELEAGQCLGQKNTMVTLSLVLLHLPPIAAVGPVGYILWHNLFNATQLWRRRRSTS
ncbi:MAG: hypothetical protein EA425_16555 [Puniceicoccaceae bacterium]|nr:MAG: hypothetical protein EA425_16555 [Puniceicoccaceae bacterium]